ncbi:MAG: O-methyltransferase [Myxococcales bacterium]|nr:MAG: O-methyltransferase [Myxococcales bacterium]
MTTDLWQSVDAHLCGHLLAPDPVLDEALRANAAAGLPPIDVSPNQGKLLMLLAQMRGARSILEVGTLGGYSTIWLARALPADGELVSLELSPHHAEVARANVARAGLAARVTVTVGPALDSLQAMVAAGHAPFDLIFIDADKKSYPHYLDESLKLARRGTVLVLDNVVRQGRVLNEPHPDADIQGLRQVLAQLGTDRRLDATAIQTVGSKGHDGLAVAIVQ